MSSLADAAPPDPQGAGVDGQRLLTPPAQAQLRAEIEQAGGAEVTFGGRADAEGRVASLEVLSRGHATAAPALVQRALEFDALLHNHPSGTLLPSEADLHVAHLLGESGVGFLIVDNLAQRAYAVVPVRERRGSPLTPEVVQAFLDDDGPLARALGGSYEPRAGQVRMSHEVARALAGDRVALLEAGTGTGKTFAYLVPGVLHALGTGERVVVSTATKHLQEQIAAKDAPLLARALEAEGRGKLRLAVVKGRGNYVSLRRAGEAARLQTVDFGSDAEAAEVARLTAWATTTPHGDRTELSPPPSAEAWDYVSSQADNCLGLKCPSYRECHYYAARQKASQAQVIVVNHSLLFADLAIKGELGFKNPAVLPPFSRVILDEAHHVERAAGDHFGAQLTRLGALRALGKLARQRNHRRGALGALQRRLLRLAGEAPQRLARHLEEVLLPLRLRCGEQLELAFDRIVSALAHELQGYAAIRQRLGAELGELAEPLATLHESLTLLTARLRQFVEEAKAILSERDQQALQGPLKEVESASRRLERTAQAVAMIQQSSADFVRWVEITPRRGKAPRVSLHAVPLDVGPLLREALFERAATVVLCSATLTIQGRFKFLEQRLGLSTLPAARLQREVVPSPFDYGRQALLAVPGDLPFPTRGEYEGLACGLIAQLLRRSQGRAFVLFTAYSALRRARAQLERELAGDGFALLAQGELSRGELLARFRDTPRAVLLGTDSFWEGVDVAGDTLVLVVIARLPFRVPTEPLQEARAEAIERRGGNAFLELQLPEAVLKLKQGFGRLIRRQDDRGCVVVCDRRIVAKWYGRVFFESLPGPRVEVLPAGELADAIAPWVR
ncbi:MAG: helicase [Planctomycetes bacterium]|nr:helicase [Planctomycetota bacterium]